VRLAWGSAPPLSTGASASSVSRTILQACEGRTCLHMAMPSVCTAGSRDEGSPTGVAGARRASLIAAAGRAIGAGGGAVGCGAGAGERAAVKVAGRSMRRGAIAPAGRAARVLDRGCRRCHRSRRRSSRMWSGSRRAGRSEGGRQVHAPRRDRSAGSAARVVDRGCRRCHRSRRRSSLTWSARRPAGPGEVAGERPAVKGGGQVHAPRWAPCGPSACPIAGGAGRSSRGLRARKRPAPPARPHVGCAHRVPAGLHGAQGGTGQPGGGRLHFGLDRAGAAGLQRGLTYCPDEGDVV
jgi:hypothetical protein